MNPAENLSSLRSLMRQRNIDAYLIPSADPHQSEYLPNHWKSREWLSGFTGSAGILVVTQSFAGLWTDERYFLQAEQELEGSGILLKKQQIPHSPEHIAWLKDHLPKGAVLALDGRLFSIRQVQFIEKHFNAAGISLDIHTDLIDLIWKDRPPLPEHQIFEHDTLYAGITRKEKIEQVRAAVQKQQAAWLLSCALDDIAWALNLRGSDIECNPLFIAYLLIGPNTTTLFTPATKLSEQLRRQLEKEGLRIRPYREIETALRSLPGSSVVLTDPESTNSLLHDCIQHTQVIYGNNPIREQKAIKNPTETFHIRHAMRNDGVALAKLFIWLEEQLSQGNHVNEYQVAEQLKTFRALYPEYKGESFPAIVGYNANGAIIHYRPQPRTAATLYKTGILLLDSGGQYLNGTTDITRTIALGTPSAAQKFHYTQVLKGHIALASAHFPKGTVGIQLDALARAPLWRNGLNFGHGTGHGVGFFLGVHEGPQGFAGSTVTSRGTTPLAPGMLTSNEPGYYLPGHYGIRIENLLLCQPSAHHENFLALDTVSLFPFDLQLIEVSALSAEEVVWLNDYHDKVFEGLAPGLNETEKQWLAEKCRRV